MAFAAMGDTTFSHEKEMLALLKEKNNPCHSGTVYKYRYTREQ